MTPPVGVSLGAGDCPVGLPEGLPLGVEGFDEACDELVPLGAAVSLGETALLGEAAPLGAVGPSASLSDAFRAMAALPPFTAVVRADAVADGSCEASVQSCNTEVFPVGETARMRACRRPFTPPETSTVTGDFEPRTSLSALRKTALRGV